MILGIDATNIRAGGGLTHLKEILSNGEPLSYGITKIIIWSNTETLSKLPNKDWLQKETHSWLNKSFIFSFLFQIILLSKLAKKNNVDLLFVPGGTFLGTFPNIVSMSQNMLPFEKEERNRFSGWKLRLRFKILEKTQSHTFRKSKGIIFLTNYAKDYISKKLLLTNKAEIISHGINLNFLQEPKEQRNIKTYSEESPFKLLYVSIVTVYKHQWNVAEAVLKLKEDGFPVHLQIVGEETQPSMNQLNAIIKEDQFKCIESYGLIPYEKLTEIYKNADGFVFASSCENQPIILLEAMSAGLPVACSNIGPMPEVLGDAGVYFNPLDTKDIYTTLKLFLQNDKDRQIKVNKSFAKSQNHSWKDCANITFEYLKKISDANYKK